MKNRTNRLLLAQIRLQFEEKLENDKVFASKEHIYTPFQFYHPL